MLSWFIFLKSGQHFFQPIFLFFMILYFFSEHDTTAKWLVNRLYQYIQPREIISISDIELIQNSKIDILIPPENGNQFSIKHLDRVINSNEITCCINTLTLMPYNGFISICKSDMDYVQQEWHSVLLSILFIMENKMLFNTPKPYALHGIDCCSEMAIAKAQEAGIRTVPSYFDSENANFPMANYFQEAPSLSLIVYNGDCYADERILAYIPKGLKEKLIQLQHLLSLKIMMVELKFDHTGFYFSKVFDTIDFRAGGEMFIQKIIENISIPEIV